MRDLFAADEDLPFGTGNFCPELGDFCWESECERQELCIAEKFQDG